MPLTIVAFTSTFLTQQKKRWQTRFNEWEIPTFYVGSDLDVCFFINFFPLFLRLGLRVQLRHELNRDFSINLWLMLFVIMLYIDMHDACLLVDWHFDSRKQSQLTRIIVALSGVANHSLNKSPMSSDCAMQSKKLWQGQTKKLPWMSYSTSAAENDKREVDIITEGWNVNNFLC